MKYVLKALVTVACVGMIGFSVANGAEQAQVGTKSGWRISLGGSYRDFDSPVFSKVSLPSGPSFAIAGGQSGMSYSQMVADFDAQKSPTATTGFLFQPYQASRALVSYDSASSYTGAESLAPVVGVATDVWQDEGLSLSLLGNFQFFNMNSAGYERTTNQTCQLNAFYDYAKKTDNIIETIDDIEHKWRPGAAVVSKKKFAMDLYVFDLGLSLNYVAAENLQVFVAGGPTFSIADMESSNGLGKNEDEVEFEYGVYMSCGGTYWFNETYGLSAEVRYDNCFGTVGTPFVKQDLDSASGMLKFVMKF